MFNKVLLLILTLTFSSLAHAKTVEIEMLNKLGKEKMLYSVKLAEVDVNDKIIWKSTTKGHNVEFVVMPKGVKKFKSKPSILLNLAKKSAIILEYACPICGFAEG